MSWADFLGGLANGAFGSKRANFWGSGLATGGNALGFASNMMGWGGPDKPDKNETDPDKIKAYRDYKRDSSAVSAAGNVANVAGDLSKIVGTVQDKSDDASGVSKTFGVLEGLSAMVGHGASGASDIFSALHYGGNLTKTDKGGNEVNKYSDKTVGDWKKTAGIVGGGAGLLGNVFGCAKILSQYVKARKNYSKDNDKKKMDAATKKARTQALGTLFSALGNAGKLWGAFSTEKGDTAHYGGSILGAIGQLGGMGMGIHGMYQAGKKPAAAAPVPPAPPAPAGPPRTGLPGTRVVPPPVPPAPSSAPDPSPTDEIDLTSLFGDS